MKKAIVSMVMFCAILATPSLMAQDKTQSTKTKTEKSCCTKEKKENKKSCCKADSKGEKKADCTKKSK